jgi:hypothetical protein
MPYQAKTMPKQAQGISPGEKTAMPLQHKRFTPVLIFGHFSEIFGHFSVNLLIRQSVNL